MTIDVKVRLRGKHLDVIDGDDGIPIPQGQGHRVIVWEFDGVALANAQFELENEPATPGFSWVSTVPKYVFSKAIVSPDRKRVILEVNNVSKATSGHFIYMLRARINPGDQDVVSTLKYPNKSDRRTVTNPVIINR